MKEFSIDFHIEKPFSKIQEMFWFNFKLMSYREWIIDQYCQKDRLYHGLFHIASMWNVHHQMMKNSDSMEVAFRPIKEQCDAIVYAILYHDIVYDSKAPSGENEKKSEKVWRDHFHDQIQTEKVEIVAGMISATANHLDNEAYPIYIDWLLDLDLSGLASPWDMFKLNNDLIRLEYSHVSDFDFRRADFLRLLLAKPKIYRTSAFECFEGPARNNIIQLLECNEKVYEEQYKDNTLLW